MYLYGKPSIHIEDLWLRADLAPDLTTGTLSPRLRLSGQTQGARITCTVTDPLGRCLLEESIDPAADQTFQLPNIHPWSHEHPVLYSVLFSVWDSEGQLVELVPYKTGFRHFELKTACM